jgi:multiple antibiotic resistance protein
MIETGLIASTTLFATVGPQDIAALFAALTAGSTAAKRRAIALKATLIAGGILFFFAFFGDALLALFGITLPALRTAGGILLLLIAIDLVFARQSGGTSTTSEENEEAVSRPDISVFPLATPLIAGPGSIGAVVLLIANTEGDRVQYAAILMAIAAILLLTFLLMLIAVHLQKLLGVTGIQVVSRIVGVLLAALAVQFIFDGLAASGIFS